MVDSKYKIRGGFTLLELLVVILIIGMLAALLLPAVNSAGGGSRRSICNNDIRQLALASCNFETARNRFPGYLEQPIPDHEREFPWLVSLMPHLERNDVYDSWMNPENPPAKPYLKVLRCLCNPPIKWDDDCNSYIGNAGLIVTTMIGPNTLYEDDNLPFNGVFVDLRRSREAPTFVQRKHFFDGQSNTLIVSENLLAGGWGDVSPIVVPGEPSSKVKLTTSFCWFDTETPTTDMQINGNRPTAMKLTPELLRPSSNHVRGVNAAFADGHTYFIRENIDYRVYKQLMTPNNKKSSNSDQSYVLKDSDYD